jgi:outer membrane protein
MKNGRRRWQILLATVALLVASPVWSQIEKPLGLSDAIDFSLKNNRQLLAAKRHTEAAERGVGQARGAFFPRVDWVESFTYTNKPTMVFSSLLDQGSFKQRNFALSALNDPAPLSNLSSQIRVEQPLYTGGRLSADLTQAEAGARASEEYSRRTRHEVIFRVTEAYYHARLAEGSLLVVEKALDSSRFFISTATRSTASLCSR